MLSVFLGSDCNNHCVFCSQRGALGRTLDPSPLPSPARGEGGINSIAFVGGEPTLSGNLLEAVSEAKKSGIEWVLLQTNARRLAYPGYAEILATAGVNALDASLQGSTPAMHDYHTQVPGSWTQTLLGLRRAKEAGLVFGISTVVTRSNFRHLEEIVRLAHHWGALAVHWELAQPYGRASLNADQVIPAPELAMEFIVPAVRLALQLGLGIYVFGHFAGNADARRLFAGIGEHNKILLPPSSPSPQMRQGSRTRPQPGVRERRVQEKISGEALRAIFPDLFSETKIHG